MSVSDSAVNSLDYWRSRAEESEARLRWSKAETGEALRILRWAAADELPERLALHAYDMEQLALGCRDALHAAVAQNAEHVTTIARLRRRVHDLTPRRRKPLTPRSSAPADQVAA
jgi:hypothetical protein